MARLRRMAVERRQVVIGLLVSVLAAVALAVAPLTCSESSEGDGPVCQTVFGYSSPLP